MNSLFRNVRFYVLVISSLFSLTIYFWVINLNLSEQVKIIRLQQIYALTAITLLYFAILAGPITYTFKWLPYKNNYMNARRALGVSAFFFGLLHVVLSFFGQLGGFEGIQYLNSKYLFATSLSFTGLIILFLMAITSYDYVISKITIKKWKLLHRLVYIAGLFILIHALMLGTHFQDLSEFIPQILFFALAFLLCLEALRFDHFLREKFNFVNEFGITFTFVIGSILTYALYLFFPQNSTPSLGIHSQHIQMAKQTQLDNNSNFQNIPSLNGDKNLRFNVVFEHDEKIKPNEDVTLSFSVFDAFTGKQILSFETIHDRLMHLVIVDNELKYFDHIHPEADGTKFSIKTKFPKDGIYHLYSDFQPDGATEQRFGFILNVGETSETKSASFSSDANLAKTFGDYEVNINYPSPLRSELLFDGQQEITFTIKDSKSKKPITNLKPYLAAFGHLVMINQKTFDYIHVHPINLLPPNPDDKSGPEVKFMPIGSFGPIKPGIYRVFAQFNPNNKLILADFTLEIK